MSLERVENVPEDEVESATFAPGADIHQSGPLPYAKAPRLSAVTAKSGMTPSCKSERVSAELVVGATSPTLGASMGMANRTSVASLIEQQIADMGSRRIRH
jgi:hypothetical protein